MADINYFVERMKYWCEQANLGYSQSDRWHFDPNGGNCDCSSLVIHCLQEAGFDTGSATTTRDLSSNLCARGWQRIANDGNPQIGDICLNDEKHTAVCTAPGMLSYASIDESGGISGQPGDQTGRETLTGNYYNFPWDCYLRYSGTPTPPSPVSAGTYICVCDCCNVRTAPTLTASVVAQYHRNETVILNGNFINADGWLWGEYIGATSGKLRYVAIRSDSGEVLWNQC